MIRRPDDTVLVLFALVTLIGRTNVVLVRLSNRELGVSFGDADGLAAGLKDRSGFCWGGRIRPTIV